jgi:hypothetical protein
MVILLFYFLNCWQTSYKYLFLIIRFRSFVGTHVNGITAAGWPWACFYWYHYCLSLIQSVFIFVFAPLVMPILSIRHPKYLVMHSIKYRCSSTPISIFCMSLAYQLLHNIYI